MVEEKQKIKKQRTDIESYKRNKEDTEKIDT